MEEAMGKSAFGTIRRLPSGKYQARVRIRGRQLTLGSYDTRRDAQAAIASAGSTSTRNVRFDPTKGRQRVEVFAESWWASRSGHRPSTRARDRLILDHDVLPFFGRVEMADVNAGDVQEWIGALARRPLSPSTVRRVFTILDQLFDSAVDLGFIAASPTERARLPRVTRTEMRFLTPAELEHLADIIDEHYRAMVLTMAWATLRIGEATGLRRADVDVVAGTIRVANNVVEVAGKLHEGPPKTAAGRRAMRLPPSLVDELASHVDQFSGTTYVFATPEGEVLHAEDWRTLYWRPAVERAGLAPLRPHDLKHSGVAFLAAAGVDPGEIARRAGHASVASPTTATGISFRKSTSKPPTSLKPFVLQPGSHEAPFDWRGAHHDRHLAAPSRPLLTNHP
jgi:integrase